VEDLQDGGPRDRDGCIGSSRTAEDWDEVRLVHEFSHHVGQILGFLNDVLMPRKLEAHLDHGFEAVRDVVKE
jgi:hypothetical protein